MHQVTIRVAGEHQPVGVSGGHVQDILVSLLQLHLQSYNCKYMALFHGSCTYINLQPSYINLEMLSSAACSMDTSTFSSLPSSTNAVESLHRIAKGKHRDVLKVALMSVYKTDMASALEHIAAAKNIPTSYERLTPTVRAQRAVVAHRARAKRMRDDDDNGDGPPDKRSDFRKFYHKRTCTCTTSYMTL